MMNLRKLLSWQLGNNNILYKAMTVVSLIGFSDAAYLLVKNYFGEIAQCFITTGCEEVLASQYSHFLGMPLSVWGILYYSLVFILINIADVYGGIKFLRVLHSVILIGFILSLSLLYIQIFVLEALCIYCLISLTVSSILMILMLIIKKNSTKTSLNEFGKINNNLINL